MKKRIQISPSLITEENREQVKQLERALNLQIEVLRRRGWTFRRAHMAVELMMQAEMKKVSGIEEVSELNPTNE